MFVNHSDPFSLQESSELEYVDPSPDSEDSEYKTPLTATISVSTIKEIMGVSWMEMFPDGYSEGISSWVSDEDVDRSFWDMAVGFPRLEEFG